MDFDRDVYAILARLLRYPAEGFTEDLDDRVAQVRASCPRAGKHLEGFRDFAMGVTPGELEETFTRTFDNSQSAALEIGWHLFGESYDRGAHLVRMREMHRELGIDEGGELPDHLSNVLQAMAACSPEVAREIALDMVEPSVKKICISLASGENPYEPVLDAVLASVSAHVHESCCEHDHV